MEKEIKTYVCEKCRQKTLTVTKNEYGAEGICSSCGYHFKDRQYFDIIFKSINKFSGIAAILCIAMLLAFIFTSSGQLDTVNRKMYDEDASLRENLTNIDTKITEIASSLTAIDANIANIGLRLSSAESAINSLNIITGDIALIKLDVSYINENISNLWAKYNSVTGSNVSNVANVNITMTYFANQTGPTRHCNLSFLAERKTIDLNDIKYMINCPNATITLASVGGDSILQQYNNVNSYALYWFGNSSRVFANYTINWNIADYNTSRLGENLNHLLSINSVFFDTLEIWEVELV